VKKNMLFEKKNLLREGLEHSYREYSEFVHENAGDPYDNDVIPVPRPFRV
jgi:uncharacterized membrane protein